MTKRTSFPDWEDIATMAIQKKREETHQSLGVYDESLLTQHSKKQEFSHAHQ